MKPFPLEKRCAHRVNLNRCISNVAWFVWLMLAATHVSMGEISGTSARSTAFNNYTQKIRGSTVKFEMVAIPGGTMTLGSPSNEPGREINDLPCRTITIKPFWIGRCEVSWQEFLPYLIIAPTNIYRYGNIRGLIDRDGITRPSELYGDLYRERGVKGYPAIGMGLPAAYEYCRWLTKRTGIRYRLPTEEEWEYACRAGSTHAYYWGQDATQAKNYGWFADNSNATTQQLGKLKPNRFGLFDMVGNVAEWCFDPSKPPTFVVRGGAFSEPVNRLRSASRMIETAEWNELDPLFPQSIWWLSAADFVGFRVARSFDEKETKDSEATIASYFPPPAVKGKPNDARANYLRSCVVCHGLKGKGDTPVGKRLGTRDYSDPKVKATLRDEAMFKSINDGFTFNNLPVMSSYARDLSDHEIKALVDYMKAF